MNIVDRIKNILITPKTEWDVIAGESTPTAQLITGYVLPLAAVAAIAQFIGSVFVGTSLGPLGSYRMPLGIGAVMLVYNVVMAVVMVFIVGLIIDALATSFGGQKNNAQALKVAVYCFTPGWIGGILGILPMLGILGALIGLYGAYLLYLGLPKLMKNPDDKSAGYTVVVIIAAIVVGVIVGAIAALFTAPAMLGAAAVSEYRTPAVTAKSESMAKLDEFAKKMDAAGKKMEEAQKSGDPNKQMAAAMQALGTAMSGGTKVDPVAIDVLKPFAPESFAGLARTSSKAERSGMEGMMISKVQSRYGQGAKSVSLEITDTGGAAALIGMASWMGLQGEREDDNRIERTRKEGDRIVHEEVAKRGGSNKYAVVLASRYVVSATGNGVDFNEVKGAVNSLDLKKLEALK